MKENVPREKKKKPGTLKEYEVLEAIMESGGVFITILDREGRIVRFNRCCQRVTGYTLGEVEGKCTWDLLVPAEEIEKVKEVFNEVISGVTPRTNENKWVTKNNEKRVFSWTNTALYRGEIPEFVVSTGIEITDRRQAEEELRRQVMMLQEEKEKLSVTLSSIGDAVIAVDTNAVIDMINPAAEKLTEWSESEARGRLLADVFNIRNEFTGEPVENPVQKVLAYGEVVGLANHTELIAKGGTRRSIADSAAPIRDKEGNILGVILVFRDVTRERQMEEALRKSEERFRLLAENAEDVVFRLKLYPELEFEYVSPAMSGITGYTPEEHYADPELIFKVVHPDDFYVLENVTKGTYEGPVQLRWICKDNSVTYVEQSNTLIHDNNGNLIAIEGIARDITEKKQAEEEMQKARKQLEEIIEFLPDATFVIDNEGKVIAWNKAIEIMTGVPKKDMIGKGDFAYAVPFYGYPRPMLIDFIYKGAKEKEATIYYDSITEKGNNLYTEVVVPNISWPGGAVLWGTASPLYDKEGNIAGAIESIRDITERKKIEDQLKYLSIYDSLTGLYNRSFFEHELHRLQNIDYMPLGIVVCDVDGLKLVNDTLGHDAGDKLLKVTAELIKECFSEKEILARIGGDEFAVLMVHTGQELIENACQKLRNSVERYNSDNDDVLLSISIGYSVSNKYRVDAWELFKKADDNMYREKLHRSKSARSALVDTLMKALEARDFITEGHADRLQEIVMEIGYAAGLTEQRLSDLRLLAQFHDIGKVGIPDRILFKPGPLSEEEKKEMQRHCEIGYRIAQSSPDLAPVADWILKHHEWWNGEGYPLGLKGEEIPLECRILALADAYDAMTNDRPYRDALPWETALEEIEKFSGIQFDPNLVPKLIDAVS